MVSSQCRLRSSAEKVVKRMKNRAAAAAFLAWLFWTQERTKKKLKLRQAIGALRNVAASAAFKAWWFEVQSRRFGTSAPLADA